MSATEGIQNGRHLVSFRSAIPLIKSLSKTGQMKCFLCKEVGTKPYSLTTFPSISVRDIFDIHRGKVKAFKLLKTAKQQLWTVI